MDSCAVVVRQGSEDHAFTQLLIKLMHCIEISCTRIAGHYVRKVTKDNYWLCLLALPRSIFRTDAVH